MRTNTTTSRTLRTIAAIAVAALIATACGGDEPAVVEPAEPVPVDTTTAPTTALETTATSVQEPVADVETEPVDEPTTTTTTVVSLTDDQVDEIQQEIAEEAAPDSELSLADCTAWLADPEIVLDEQRAAECDAMLAAVAESCVGMDCPGDDDSTEPEETAAPVTTLPPQEEETEPEPTTTTQPETEQESEPTTTTIQPEPEPEPTTTLLHEVTEPDHDHAGPLPEPDHDHTETVEVVTTSDRMPSERGKPAPPYGWPNPNITAGVGPTASPAVQAFTDWCFWDLPNELPWPPADIDRAVIAESCSAALTVMTNGLRVVTAGTPNEACILAAYRSNIEPPPGFGEDGGPDWLPSRLNGGGANPSAAWWGDCATHINAVPWSEADKSGHCATAVQSLGGLAPEGWCEIVVYPDDYTSYSDCGDALRLVGAYLRLSDPGYVPWESTC